MFICTLRNKFRTLLRFDEVPFTKNLLTLSLVIWRVTITYSAFSKPVGLAERSGHLKRIVTEAFSIPAKPSLYISQVKPALSRRYYLLVDPNKNWMASRILLLPEPLSPVIALNWGSKPPITVRFIQVLNPSKITSETYIQLIQRHQSLQSLKFKEITIT